MSADLLAVRCGSAAEFAAAVEAHRRELRAHCRRLVGGLDAAEDLVQETFVRAWRARTAFEGRSTLRTWLYRIATNACLDAVRRDRHLAGPIDATEVACGRAPGALLWRAPPQDPDGGGSEPEAAVVARETLELALLAAVRHLPARQRAVLVLRDGLGWSAREAAQAAGTTVAGANSALQRARARLARAARAGRLDWHPGAAPDPEELEVLAHWIGVVERFTGATALT
ncbi:MAG TPA: sigma-70 family RNA polymerase sigma factor [Acidimicrobiales bacterium]